LSGTGKSFVGIKIAQLLVKNSLTTPILCLCYTNHALDQFLESLIEAGMSGVVRVGSRCKKQNLEKMNLATLRKTKSSDHISNRLRWEYSKSLQEREPSVKGLSKMLCSSVLSFDDDLAVENVRIFLQENHPQLLRSLDGMDPDDSSDSEQDFFIHQSNKEVMKNFATSFEAWSQDKCFNPLCRLHGLKKFFKPHNKETASNQPKKKKKKGKTLNTFQSLSLNDDAEALTDRNILTRLVRYIAAAGQVMFKGGLPYEAMNQVISDVAKNPGVLKGTYSKNPGKIDLQQSLEDLGFHTLKELLEYGSVLPDVQLTKGMSLSEIEPDLVTYQCKSDLSPYGVIAIQDIECRGSPSLQAGETFACIKHSKTTFSIARLVETSAGPFTLLPCTPTHTHRRLSLRIDEFPHELFCPLHETQRQLPQLLDLRVYDMWSFSPSEKNIFKSYIFEHIREDLITCLSSEMRNIANDIKNLKTVGDSDDLDILKKAKIVGMTTTGAANLQSVIRALGPKIVIIEEAAEVLEAHVLASLSPETQHIIMIGDHQQLRPKIEFFQLAVESKKNYNLDLSMFERLVRAFEFRAYALSHQRRMRPCVSHLIRSIYPQLKDHAKVHEYPDVQGTSSNVFFFDHNHPEDGEKDDESSSKVNEFEAHMVVGFARYLLLQGYAPGEITILTPYLGQLKRLQTLLAKTTLVFIDDRDEEELDKLGSKKGRETGDAEIWPAADIDDHQQNNDNDFSVVESIGKRLRLATIDNFQGEESKIVLISLVRNNQRGAIGFLKTTNRINVLLSRAMHGMFLFGHSPSLVKDRNSKMWPQVLDILRSKGQLGVALLLKCKNHPDTVSEITTPEHFEQFVGDGGCSRACTFRLNCGHTCPRRCHPDDLEHVGAYCPKPCSRLRSVEDCPYHHPCPLLCGDACGPCKVPITEVHLPCGHVARNVPCYMERAPHEIYCTRKVVHEMKGCGHKLTINCGEVARFSRDSAECFETCGHPLKCGHVCSAKCGECHQKGTEELSDGSKHVVCSSRCGKEFMCGHSCVEMCHGAVNCKPCLKRCPVRCLHSICPLACHNVCAPCIEKCEWKCEHEGSCPEPCGAPCTRKVCDKRCTKMLTCGHPCPSVCGEPCPSPDIACNKCATSNARGHVVDLLLFKTLADYEVDKSGPLIALPCKHVYSVESLDGYMELSKHYRHTELGEWREAISQTQEIKRMLSCPDCREPITGVFRYGRVVNKGVLDNITCKFQVNGQGKLCCIRDELKRVQRDSQPQNKALKEIEKKARALCDTKHPLQKIYDAARSRASRTLSRSRAPPTSQDITLFDKFLPPDQSVHAESGLLLFQTKLTKLMKSKKMTSNSSGVDSIVRWKQIVGDFVIEQQIKGLITLMEKSHMFSSVRDVLCVVAPGALELVDCCVRAMRAARGQVTGALTEAARERHKEAAIFFSDRGNRSLDFAKYLAERMAHHGQQQQRHLLAVDIVRNRRNIVLATVSCISDLVQGANPNVQASIKQQQREMLDRWRVCLEEYVLLTRGEQPEVNDCLSFQVNTQHTHTPK
jgi:hypothetical protein